MQLGRCATHDSQDDSMMVGYRQVLTYTVAHSLPLTLWAGADLQRLSAWLPMLDLTIVVAPGEVCGQKHTIESYHLVSSTHCTCNSSRVTAGKDTSIRAGNQCFTQRS